MSNEPVTVSIEVLSTISGGFSRADMPVSAQAIVELEATSKNKSPTALGPFGLSAANRKRFLGKDSESDDPAVQYRGASLYAKKTYGGWDGALKAYMKNGYY